MEENKLPIYELSIDDINFEGMKAISIVEFPAIEEDFMKFSKQIKLGGGNVYKKDNLHNEVSLSKLDTEKRIITGPALIPDKLIYRNVKGRGEFNIKFTSEVIEKLNINFFENFKQQSINMEHNTEVNNVTVIESWIVENSENDKSTELGFEVPSGTWMISMKVNNPIVWDKIKSGELKGFSIEALLSNHIIEQSLDINEKILNDIKEIINKNNNIDLETFIDDLDDIIKDL